MLPHGPNVRERAFGRHACSGCRTPRLPLQQSAAIVTSPRSTLLFSPRAHKLSQLRELVSCMTRSQICLQAISQCEHTDTLTIDHLGFRRSYQLLAVPNACILNASPPWQSSGCFRHACDRCGVHGEFADCGCRRARRHKRPAPQPRPSVASSIPDRLITTLFLNRIRKLISRSHSTLSCVTLSASHCILSTRCPIERIDQAGDATPSASRLQNISVPGSGFRAAGASSSGRWL
ncbi:hypothetical protein B0T16DRAFT_410768 [Cercophora newfieldiana]|uniref:Uncharacterized protein n=1 Tax=Cercophora newfieldiana TaxID=92897 RepID=A0AA39YC00_9PEZI|nr:hypothetical protein B0T16DRAFT_410768 [Cercophora newfieldiana]